MCDNDLQRSDSGYPRHRGQVHRTVVGQTTPSIHQQRRLRDECFLACMPYFGTRRPIYTSVYDAKEKSYFTRSLRTCVVLSQCRYVSFTSHRMPCYTVATMKTCQNRILYHHLWHQGWHIWVVYSMYMTITSRAKSSFENWRITRQSMAQTSRFDVTRDHPEIVSSLTSFVWRCFFVNLLITGCVGHSRINDAYHLIHIAQSSE